MLQIDDDARSVSEHVAIDGRPVGRGRRRRLRVALVAFVQRRRAASAALLHQPLDGKSALFLGRFIPPSFDPLQAIGLAFLLHRIRNEKKRDGNRPMVDTEKRWLCPKSGKRTKRKKLGLPKSAFKLLSPSQDVVVSQRSQCKKNILELSIAIFKSKIIWNKRFLSF